MPKPMRRYKPDILAEMQKKELDELRTKLARPPVVWPYDDAPFDGPQVKDLLDENSRLRRERWSAEVAEAVWIAVCREVPRHAKKRAACLIVDLFAGSGADTDSLREAKTLAYDSGIPWMQSGQHKGNGTKGDE
jgi:hypothetical protein